MVDDKGFLKKDLADDGLHPNPVGYKIMAPLAESAIEKALAGQWKSIPLEKGSVVARAAPAYLPGPDSIIPARSQKFYNRY